MSRAAHQRAQTAKPAEHKGNHAPANAIVDNRERRVGDVLREEARPGAALSFVSAYFTICAYQAPRSTLADSVGLGKTWTALAVIRPFQRRNERVLVLCPKRLEQNWLRYAAHTISPRGIDAASAVGLCWPPRWCGVNRLPAVRRRSAAVESLGGCQRQTAGRVWPASP